MKQTIKVELHDGRNKHEKRITLNVQTRCHLAMGKMLHKITGMKKNAPNSYPEGMNHAEVFHFTLQKDTRASWDEILPKIREVMRNHFMEKYSREKTVEFKDSSTLKTPGYMSYPGFQSTNFYAQSKRA